MTLSQKITIHLVQFFRTVRNQILVGQVGGLSHCRYSESCGNYLVRQVKEVGVWAGLVSGFKRIVSCQGFI